jgi:hypothetical protein
VIALVLEIQEKLLPFLVDCCANILQKYDLGTDGLQKDLVLEEPDRSSLSSGDPNLAFVNQEAAYRFPGPLEFSCLQKLVSERCSEGDNHVHRLREDSGYFAARLLEWSKNRMERVLDKNGESHTRLWKRIFWKRVIRAVIEDAYLTLIQWHSVRELLGILKDSQGQESANNTPRVQAPSTVPGLSLYLDWILHIPLACIKWVSRIITLTPEQKSIKASLTLSSMLEDVQKRKLDLLKEGVPGSTSFRDWLIRGPSDSSSQIPVDRIAD